MGHVDPRPSIVALGWPQPPKTEWLPEQSDAFPDSTADGLLLFVVLAGQYKSERSRVC